MPQLLRPPPPPPNRLALPAKAAAPKAWSEVLRACGYPTDVLVIDFETYFDDDYHMRRGNEAEGLSTIEYVQDERFEVMSCAFTLMGAEFDADAHTRVTRGLVGEEKIKASLEYWFGEREKATAPFTVVAQNAAFDCTVLSRRFGIHPKYLIDILGLARAMNARQKNDLGTLCKQYGLKDKGNTEDFSGLSFRPRWFKPKRGPKIPQLRPRITDEQIEKLRAYNINDNLREWELFTILLPRLSNPQIELPLMQHHIEMFTKPTLRVDFAKGAELIARMEKEIAATIPQGITREEISGDKSFEKLIFAALDQAGDNRNHYVKQGKLKPILAIAKTDDAREKLLTHDCPTVQQLAKARVAVDSWPNHIKRIQRIMGQAKADKGLLAVPLKYCGAHTGRASGGEGINLQNLGSRGDPLITAVREMIVAPAGHKLVIVDAAAIEARVLAWIAGQWDLVEKFKNGQEIYCDFAAKVLGYAVRKPRKSGGIPEIEQRMGWARNSVGKIGVLGCGYGMGAEKTQGYAKGAITFEIAEKIVQVYRAENREIVKFWRDIEKSFRYTFNYRKPCAMERGLRFDPDPHNDTGVTITLPNGRELHYPKVRDDYGGLGLYNGMKRCWEYTWGGTLTENVVQAMSRDVLMEAMLRLEARGYHTALHVHDELVLVVPEDRAETCLQAALDELSMTPTWAPRLALAAEGSISDCYGKH